jgi:hypothetical protein
MERPRREAIRLEEDTARMLKAAKTCNVNFAAIDGNSPLSVKHEV